MSQRFTWKHHTSAVHKYEDTQNQILITEVPDEHYFINVILGHWPESGNRKMQRSHSLISYWSPNFLMLSIDSCIACYYIYLYITCSFSVSYILDTEYPLAWIHLKLQLHPFC